MKSFVIGLIVGLLILPLAFAVYVASGRMPAATSDPPMPFEAVLAGAALYARINREAPKRDVSGFATSELVSGADVYQKNCAVCHGLPGQPVPPVGKGEFPPPPQLFTVDGRVSDDPAGVTYWKVKNGIRLTGMPALSDVARGSAAVAGDGAGRARRQAATRGARRAEARATGDPWLRLEPRIRRKVQRRRQVKPKQ